MMRSATLLSLLALAGCDQPEVPKNATVASLLDSGTSGPGWEVVDFESCHTTVGALPHSGCVRSVNVFGAAVRDPNKPNSQVQVDGSNTTIRFDGHGYAAVTAQAAGSITVTGAGDDIEVHSVDSAWDTCGLMRAGTPLTDAPAFAGPVSTGVLVASTDSVWWFGRDGRGHRVLDPETDILGMRTVHIDTDGLVDALVWTDTEVLMLRGRPDAGMSWGQGVKATDYTVGGAAIADTNDDGYPDIVIAWRGGKEHWLDVWHGDGLWGFEAAPSRVLVEVPGAVGVGDNTGEGRLQITVMNEIGEWERFVYLEGRYIPTGPLLDFQIDPASDVFSGYDINRDGGDEVVFIAPYTETGAREIYSFDLLGDVPEYVQSSPAAAYLQVLDVNDDDIADIMKLEKGDTGTGTLGQLSADPKSDPESQVPYNSKQLDSVPEHAPFAMRDQDRDGIPELFLAGKTTWNWYNGGLYPDANDFAWWGIDAPPLGHPLLPLVGPIHVAGDLDGNANSVEVIGFQDDNGQITMRIFSVPKDGTQALQRAEVQIEGNPLDIAVCGGDAWIITDDTSTANAYRVDLDVPTFNSTAAVASHLDASDPPARVDCGNGFNGMRALILTASNIRHVDANIADNPAAPEPNGGARDIAFGGVSNNRDQYGTCTDAGCSVVAWDINGTLVYAKANDTQTTLENGPGGNLPGVGSLSVGDVDNNGQDDLIAWGADGTVTIHRVHDDGIAPTERFHSPVSFAHAGGLANITDDAFPDFFFLDGDLNLRHTLECGAEDPVVDTGP